MAVAEGQVEVGALEGGAVADTGHLELLGEALGDADDHVVDERAREALLGVGVRNAVDEVDLDLAVLEAEGGAGGEGALERALGAGGLHGVPVDLNGDAGGNDDRMLADTGHNLVSFLLAVDYQT